MASPVGSFLLLRIVVGLTPIFAAACAQPMSEAEARRVYTATKSTIDRVQTSTAEAIAAVPEIVNSMPSCVGQSDCNLQSLSFQLRRNDALTALRAGAFVAAMREPGVVGLRAVMDSAETKNELVGEAGRTPPATRNPGRREANKGLLMDGQNIGWGHFEIGSESVAGIEIVRKTRMPSGVLTLTVYVIEPPR